MIEVVTADVTDSILIVATGVRATVKREGVDGLSAVLDRSARRAFSAAW